MAVLYCPECGALEPDWNGSRVDPDSKSAKIESDAKVIAALRRGFQEIANLHPRCTCKACEIARKFAIEQTVGESK